jgi:hypothetical protein
MRLKRRLFPAAPDRHSEVAVKSLPADMCHRSDSAGRCRPANRPSCPGRRGRGEQLVLSLQAFETAPAPRFEHQPGGALGEVARRARYEDLAGSRMRAAACTARPRTWSSLTTTSPLWMPTRMGTRIASRARTSANPQRMAPSALSRTTRNESPAVSTFRPPNPASTLRTTSSCMATVRFPRRVAGVARERGGVDEIGEQDRGQHPRFLTRPRVEPGAAGPVDHHEFLVALHPGHVSGWEIEHLVGADDELLPLTGANAHPSAEDHPAVVEPARSGSDQRPGVLLPAPTRLKHVAGDLCLCQANLVGRRERRAHDRLRLAQVADFNAAHRCSHRRRVSSSGTLPDDTAPRRAPRNGLPSTAGDSKAPTVRGSC